MQLAFFTANILICQKRKSTGVTKVLLLLFCCVPVSHDSVRVRQHAQHHNPETEALKWNSAVIHFIIYTSAFPTVTGCLL